MNIFNLTTRKSAAAVLLGPLLLVPVIIITYLLFAFINGVVPTKLMVLISTALSFSFYGLLVAYPATIILGIPLVLLLKRFNKLNYAAVICVAVFWSLLITFSFGVGRDVALLLVVVYSSCVVASGCWLVYKRV